MKNILLAIISAVLLTAGIIAGTTVHAPAAHAQSCQTPFYLEENDYTLYINGQGHNQQTRMFSASASEFCFIYSGTHWWYEFQDVATDECLNVGGTKYVYEDSCIMSTPEQWQQTVGGLWENRHYGTSGYLTGDNYDGGFVEAILYDPQAEQVWRLPAG